MVDAFHSNAYKCKIFTSLAMQMTEWNYYQFFQETVVVLLILPGLVVLRLAIHVVCWPDLWALLSGQLWDFVLLYFIAQHDTVVCSTLLLYQQDLKTINKCNWKQNNKPTKFYTKIYTLFAIVKNLFSLWYIVCIYHCGLEMVRHWPVYFHSLHHTAGCSKATYLN